MTSILERLENEPSLRQMMVSVARRMVGDEHAEDVVQSALLAAVRAAGGVRNEYKGSVGAYLKMATISRAIMFRRARTNWFKHFECETHDTWDNFGSESPNFDEHLDLEIIKRRIEKYLGKIKNKKHVEVVTLRLYEGLPFAEIEKLTGVKETYCKTIVMRHSTRLREILSYAIESTGMGRAAGRAKAAGIGRTDSGEQKR